MKIAHVVSTFYPRVGGMGEVCRQEAELLSQRGVDTTVFTLRYPQARRILDNHSYQVARLRSIFRFGDGGEIPQLLWRLKDFDLIHLHYPFYGGSEWVWLNKLMNHKPYVITYHMDADPGGRIAKTLQAMYDNMWARPILKGAAKIIAVDNDHFAHTIFGPNLAPEKVIEIFNAVDTDIFRPTGADWTDLGLPELAGRSVILFVGNFLSFKRFDLVYQAIKLLPAETALVAVGDGYEQDFHRAQIQTLGLADRVLFYGRCVDKNKLADLYSAADCLVVASDRAESFSLAALESLACATPVIATDIPGVRGRVADGQDGYLFSAGDHEDLAKKIKKFLNLSLSKRESFGANGRAKILAQYTWDEHLKKLLTVYQVALE